VYAIADSHHGAARRAVGREYEAAKLPRMELVTRMIGKELSQLPPKQATDANETAAPKREPFLEFKQCGRAGSIAPMDLTIGKARFSALRDCSVPGARKRRA